MNTNYYFLRQLTAQLAPQLKGLVLAECFSQDKDELVMGFSTEEKLWRKRRNVYIRATLRGDFAALAFPDEFRRAGKNSVNLFDELLNRPVQDVLQFENERGFALIFDEGWSLVFKLFGNRSNLILFNGDEVHELFNSKLLADNNLKITTLSRKIDQSYEAFERAEGNWRVLFPTFGKEVHQALETQLKGITELQARWQLVETMRQRLENPTAYFVKTLNYQLVLSLLAEGGEVVRTETDPMAAANAFYYAYTRSSTLVREKGAVLRALSRRMQKTEAYLENVWQKLTELDTAVKNEELGHLLMANLHVVPERAESIEVHDFYRDRPLRIKLKSDLSPQKNAEVYYRKSKNEKIELAKLHEALDARQAELVAFEGHCKAIEVIETIKELRKYLKENGLTESEKPIETPDTLFRRVVIDGFDVLVGKNARNNDLLTTRYARKEDLWLHARDVTGSHVVIRRKPGHAFPARVIEQAAQLAAWNSKRRTDSLCPVIVTPRKFVRKTRDLAEGQVLVEKEDVVMVVPRNWPP